MGLLQVQGLPDLVDFLDETLQPPEGAIIGLVGFPATELVIENNRTIIRQLFERFQIVVAGAGAAMEDEERDCIAGANPAIPDSMAVFELDFPLFHLIRP